MKHSNRNPITSVLIKACHLRYRTILCRIPIECLHYQYCLGVLVWYSISQSTKFIEWNLFAFFNLVRHHTQRGYSTQTHTHTHLNDKVLYPTSQIDPADLVGNVHCGIEEVSPLQEPNNFPAYPIERRLTDQLFQPPLHYLVPDDDIDSRPWFDTFNEVDYIYDRDSRKMFDCNSKIDRHSGMNGYHSPWRIYENTHIHSYIRPRFFEILNTPRFQMGFLNLIIILIIIRQSPDSSDTR